MVQGLGLDDSGGCSNSDSEKMFGAVTTGSGPEFDKKWLFSMCLKQQYSTLGSTEFPFNPAHESGSYYHFRIAWWVLNADSGIVPA